MDDKVDINQSIFGVRILILSNISISGSDMGSSEDLSSLYVFHCVVL